MIYSSVRTDTVGLTYEQHVAFLRSAMNLFYDVSVRWDFSQGFIFKIGVDLVRLLISLSKEKHFNNRSLIKSLINVFLAFNPWLMEELLQNLFKTYPGLMST